MMRWLRMVAPAMLAACCVPAQALPVTITGSVVGPEGPIAGARVEAFSTGWELSADGWGGTETDAEGAFTLITGDRAAGLVVSALGCETKIITPLPRESASVRLRPGGRSLRGRVTDRGHGPVRDVRVRIVQLDPSGDDRPVFMSVRHPVTALQALTDGEGRFEIAGLPECEELMIVAGRRSFSTVSEKLPGIPDEPVELLVAPEAVIHGRVTWDGRPVRDVQVSVYGHIWSDTTDHDGRFRLEAIPGGPVKLHVRPPSGLHAWEPERIFLTAGETREVNIHVARPATVSGAVTRVGTGDPVAGACVLAECEGGEWAEAVADEEGRYELVVPPGRVIVRFAGLREGGPQFTGRERHLDVPEVSVVVEVEQSIADVDLQVESWMTGEIVFRGRAHGPEWQLLTGATVRLRSLFPAAPEGTDERCIVDAYGYFELRPKFRRIPEELILTASVPGTDLLAAALVPGTGTRNLTLRLHRAGYVRVPVVDEAGAPVQEPEDWVEAHIIAGDGRRRPFPSESAMEPGAIVVGPLPSLQEIVLTTNSRGHDYRPTNRVWRHSVILQPGEHAEAPPLVMVPGGRRISGRVLDERERPVRWALVYSTALIGRQEPVETDAQGRFMLAPLRAWGEAVVIAASRTGTRCCAVVCDPAADGELGLILRPAATLHGVVLTPDGTPCRGAEVQARAIGAGASFPDLDLGGRGSATTDMAGRWRIEHLIPGFPYTITAEADALGAAADEQIDILPPGEAEPLTLRLQPVGD